jgi:hypothetical protein
MQLKFMVAKFKVSRASRKKTQAQFSTKDIKGPYTERTDLWFEPFFVKEIRRVIE